MIEFLLLLDTILTVGILVGVWWGVFASKSGDVREVVIAFQEFVKKNFADNKQETEK